MRHTFVARRHALQQAEHGTGKPFDENKALAMKLSGKSALVLGGGTGIGRAAAVSLAREGCRVAVAGRREEKLQETARQWTGEPPMVTHTVDVGDRQDVEALFAWLAENFGPVDIMVNSAGVNVSQRTMADLRPEDWEKLLRINASGAYYCMHAVLPQMRERGDGVIINVSSIAGKRASLLGGVGYSAAKFAMTALGMTASLEDGPQHGIRISTVCPGEVNTPILENRPVPVSDEHKARILQPEDVAEAILLIATLPPRAHIPELIIKPTHQEYA